MMVKGGEDILGLVESSFCASLRGNEILSNILNHSDVFMRKKDAEIIQSTAS